MLALRGGTVVDVDGARETDVAIEDGEIVAVGDAPGDPDRELDVAGRYVAPALVDAHVHLTFDGRPDPNDYRDQSVPEKAYRVTDNLRRLRERGVAAVRDLGSPADLAIESREAVADGTVPGPQVVPAGRAVVMTGGHGHWFGREADGPAEVRKAAREQLKAGAEVVKTMATGGVLTEGAKTGAPELTEAELRALVETAHAQGATTAAHAHGTEGIKNAVRAGIDSVEHGTFMDAEAAEMMAERDTYWVPTATALHGIVDAGTEGGIPPYAVEKAEAAVDAFDRTFDDVQAADVPVAMGTDGGTPFNELGSVGREMELMVEHGLEPEHALAAGTVNAADLLGIDDLGRVAAGYRAELLVLDADPRSEPSAWGSPSDVIADGTVLD
jgi:imidazolonepropionase-like amidohydrolase